jgi:hypothetical protein
MSVYSGRNKKLGVKMGDGHHDYDPIVLIVLIIGLGAVEFLVFSI